MSKETKWTEGEWAAIDHGVGELVVYSRHTDNAICILDDSDGHYAWKEGYSTSAEAKANAFLLAQAKALYEALDMLMDASGPGDAEQILAEERENIMALLAKARGETS